MGKQRTVLWVIVVVLALILLGAVVGVALWNHNVFTLQLYVDAPAEVTMEYGGTYTPPEATARFWGTVFCKDGETVAVKTTGFVDCAAVGDYTLTWEAEHRGYRQKVTQTVHVVDTQAPDIILVSDPEYRILPRQFYREEGFTATDAYDGDITHLVERHTEAGKVIYTVSDSSGNTTTVTRQIPYGDKEPPMLLLQGGEKMTVILGKEYTEPGFFAADNGDGELTQQVTVSGSVDTKTAGEYTLSYCVTDSFGNTATATRTVTVVKPAASGGYSGPATPVGGVVYLTFDDGPSGYTPKLLEVLAKYNAKATFFVVNTGALDMLSTIAAQGHSIGIHSITHNYSQIYASEEAFFADLYGMQEKIKEKTGITTMLMRFPGGSSNMVSRFNPGIMTRLTKLVEEKGFRYFDWNVSSGDASGGECTADTVYWNVINGIASKHSSVVLQHDIKGFSVDAVERILQWGLANGYTFQALGMDSPGCHHGVNN